MKVLLINGSPHEKGCTYTALAEIAAVLEGEGVNAEIFHIGNRPIRGCTACGRCGELPGRCVFDEDSVNAALEKGEAADAFVFGSPVYFGSANGAMISFLDRMFYAGDCFAFKPCACISSARRGGSTAAMDQLNKYPTIAAMPVVSANYWNMVHGNTPEEVRQDLEGMQNMRDLGRNMAWMLKCIEAGAAAGIKPPVSAEPKVFTNFIR